MSNPTCTECDIEVEIPTKQSRMPIPKLCPPCRKARTKANMVKANARAQAAIGAAYPVDTDATE